MKQVHCIDYQCGVSSVLSGRVLELLDWLDRQTVESFSPAIEIGCGPIAVSALDRGSTVPRHLPQQVTDD